MADAQDREARAEARRKRATIRKVSLEEQSDPEPTLGADGVSLAHRLTIESWALAGMTIPAYRRSEIPCRFVAGDPT